MWTEWNVPSFGPLQCAGHGVCRRGAGRRSSAQCDGLVNMMSFWTFSDVFEENGPKREPFDGGFGLIAMGGIKKPSFTGFAVLHKLGQERIAQDASNILVTRRADGKLAIAAWNLVDPDRKGSAESIEFEISGVAANAAVLVTRADGEHGNTLAAYQQVGSPTYPTRKQVAEINRVVEQSKPEELHLTHGAIRLSVPVNGIVLLEVK